MGKQHKAFDIAGNKLFGKCVREGNCICGNCLNAPINQRDNVTTIKPNGEVITESMPRIIGDDPRDWVGNRNNMEERTTETPIERYERRKAAAEEPKPDNKLLQPAKIDHTETIQKQTEGKVLDKRGRHKRTPEMIARQKETIARKKAEGWQRGGRQNGPVTVTQLESPPEEPQPAPYEEALPTNPITYERDVMELQEALSIGFGAEEELEVLTQLSGAFADTDGIYHIGVDPEEIYREEDPDEAFDGDMEDAEDAKVDGATEPAHDSLSVDDAVASEDSPAPANSMIQSFVPNRDHVVSIKIGDIEITISPIKEAQGA